MQVQWLGNWCILHAQSTTAPRRKAHWYAPSCAITAHKIVGLQSSVHCSGRGCYADFLLWTGVSHHSVLHMIL